MYNRLYEFLERNYINSTLEEKGNMSVNIVHSYGKFIIFGDSKKQIPDNIKIYNKVGYAYGTLTETAYITDKKTRSNSYFQQPSL